MKKPYTKQEILERKDSNGYVSGVVEIPLCDIIDCDLESYLDLLGMKLVGSDCLSDIMYRVVGVADVNTENAKIMILVTGNVSEVIDML